MKLPAALAAVGIAAIAIVLSAIDMPAEAGAPQCARTYAQGHSEFVVNTCTTCRRVSITRRRIGANGAPVMRTYDLRPKMKFPLPFKGPGRSRVTSDVPCRDELGGGRDILNPGKGRRSERPKACVSLQGTAKAGVVLVNKCAECRAAAVARYGSNGKSLGRQFYKLTPRASVKVARKGAASVGYLTDIACPS